MNGCHLRGGDKPGDPKDTNTLCGFEAMWDIDKGVSTEVIMNDGRTCSMCREKFVEMTTKKED